MAAVHGLPRLHLPLDACHNGPRSPGPGLSRVVASAHCCAAPRPRVIPSSGPRNTTSTAQFCRWSSGALSAPAQSPEQRECASLPVLLWSQGYTAGTGASQELGGEGRRHSHLLGHPRKLGFGSKGRRGLMERGDKQRGQGWGRFEKCREESFQKQHIQKPWGDGMGNRTHWRGPSPGDGIPDKLFCQSCGQHPYLATISGWRDSSSTVNARWLAEVSWPRAKEDCEAMNSASECPSPWCSLGPARHPHPRPSQPS